MSESQSQKTAKTSQPILKDIGTRWSPRAFADRDVEQEKLIAVLEAARWSPSSYNEQPWRFIVARRKDKAEYANMLEVLVPGNAAWATSAPVLMLTVASLKFTRNDRPNRHAWHDVGLASQSMAIQATQEGIAVHFMAGFDDEKAVDLFGIPEDYAPVAAAALGYYPKPDSGKPDERSRRALAEIVFAGRFGTRADFIA